MSNSAPTQSKIFQDLAQIVNDMGQDLHWPRSRFLKIGPETYLDKDLGLDSLSRVELLSRIERHFNVVFGERVYRNSETVHDLVDAVLSCPEGNLQTKSQSASSRISAQVSERKIEVPSKAKTLLEVLAFYVEHYPNRNHIEIYDASGEGSKLSYKELNDGAKKIARGLQHLGIIPGDAVGVMLPTSANYFYCFMGIILAGAVPVPIYPPSRPAQLNEHLMRHSRILQNCRAKILITEDLMAQNIGQLLRFSTSHLAKLVTPGALMACDGFEKIYDCQQEDTAFLQYTSGSTGNPKGVILSHANILANIRAMGEVLEASSKDVFVSWLPLYHDMGLIGAWLGSFYYACKFVVMTPFAFLSRPARWLEVIERYGGTLTAAPNFAFELCINHISQQDAKRINLNSLRVICNGAEAVSPTTVEKFNDRFRESGLRPCALTPVYGLAENTVGLCFPALGRGFRIDSVDRIKFESTGVASQCNEGDLNPLRFVGCGRPLPGHEVRIVDNSNFELADRCEGYIQFKGPSATKGYLDNESANQRVFRGGWINTGDLGYFAEGDLFVTGRTKDIIKHGGRNVHPEELESAVAAIHGIRKGCVAAFGSFDSSVGTERLIVVAETRETDELSRKSLIQKINGVVSNILGSSPDLVVLASPHTILKTSSGKIRRAACKERFEKGSLERSHYSHFYDLFSFFLVAICDRISNKTRILAITLRSFCVWAAIFSVVVMLWPIMVCLPAEESRWQVARFGAKLCLRIAGVRVSTQGKQAPGRFIYVANHASYADVVILMSVLPLPVSFVAKAELAKNPWLRLTLARLGVIFVERYEIERSLEDAKKTTEAVRLGRSIFSFPEGTFTRQTGLMAFHLGPFIASAQTLIPVMPVSIKGARSILRPDSWILRGGQVVVSFCDMLDPCDVAINDQQGIWERALYLRDLSRVEILKTCGEQELATE